MSVVILAYHGVTDIEFGGIENFQGKHLSAGVFEQQMAYLRERERVLALSEVVDACTQGRELDGVVVTFDDAYRNNLTVALPILERYEIPTTFFLTTSFIGTGRMSWVDEVECMVDCALVPEVDLTARGLGRLSLRSPQEKMDAVTGLKAHLKRRDDRDRTALLELLQTLLPLPDPSALSPNYETLNWDDVSALASSPVAEIGGHTVDHAILTRISPDQVRSQVRVSKRTLEEQLGRAVTLFAYPNGGEDDYDATAMRIVRDEGYVCACTTVPGPNTASTDPFALRRAMVGFCGEPFPFPAFGGAEAGTP